MQLFVAYKLIEYKLTNVYEFQNRNKLENRQNCADVREVCNLCQFPQGSLVYNNSK